jgi:tripartite-type tricarboxylate transporter receptor subunit TctC
MNWQGLYAPAGTPQPIVEAISRTVAGVLHKPEVRDRLAKAGFEARGDSPAVAAEQVRANVARWSKVIAAAGIKVGGAK